MKPDEVWFHCWNCKTDVEAELETETEVVRDAHWTVMVAVSAVCPHCKQGGPSDAAYLQLSS